MTNVLRVISSMDPSSGGPCQGIRNSIPELNKIGIYNEVVCLDSPDSNFLGKDSFVIHAIGKAKGPWRYNSNLSNWLKFNISRFDIVIVHGLWLYHSYITYKIIQKYRDKLNLSSPKLFIMPHGMLDPWFQKAEGRRIKAMRNWIYWKIIEERVVNNADGIFFTSSEELRLAREAFKPYHPSKELNIGYGIFEPPALNITTVNCFYKEYPQIPKMGYLLFISRIDVKKGVDLLIKSYLQLKSQGLTIPKLVIAGPGIDTEYGQEMLSLANGSPDIIFPGMLIGNHKWAAFNGCEAFILPSHQENFGIAVVEALACSKPVLISDQINIYQEILAGKGGIVKSDSILGVSQLISEWISLNPSQRVNMSLNAYRVYKDNYTIEQAALKLKKVLEH